MAYLKLRRLIELALLDRPALARVLAVVSAAWGGAWQVWTCRPRSADG